VLAAAGPLPTRTEWAFSHHWAQKAMAPGTTSCRQPIEDVRVEHTHLQSLSGVEVDFVEAHDHVGFVKDFLARCQGHRLLIELEHRSAPRRPVRSH